MENDLNGYIPEKKNEIWYANGKIVLRSWGCAYMIGCFLHLTYAIGCFLHLTDTIESVRHQ